MSITKDCGCYVLSCDMCFTDVEEEFDSFDEAVDYKKGHGWKSIKDRGEWLDMCPKCTEEYKRF